MTIIDKYKPINSKDIVDKLISELQKTPHGMTQKVRHEIYMNISKSKVQMYFNKNYPVSMFTDKAGELPQVSESPSRVPSPAAVQTSASPSTSSLFPDGTLGSRKYIYGTYIEMAFHNLFLNVEHIFAVVFGRNIMSEAAANYVPKNNRSTVWDGDFANEPLVWKPMFRAFEEAKPEEKLRIEEMMNHHFSMLKPFKDFSMASSSYSHYTTIDIIRAASEILRILRNNYSHYKTQLYENQKRTYQSHEEFMCECLDRCFIGSRRVVKDRFAFDDKAMRCTEQYIYTTDRTKCDKRGRPLRIKKEVSGFRYKLWQKDQNNKKRFTAFGLVFFTSLFLEKKYAKVMSDKLKMVARQDQSVVCEMLSVYRLRLNSQRLKVTKETDALALDIINELQRCPKDLFDILPPEEQSRFRVRPEDETAQDVLMIRHSDRFPQLVMKYIDDARLFSKLRFQVSLGKYFFRFYDKRCIDSADTRVRAICKGIKGFGRIGNIEAKRQECWDGVIRQYEDVHRNTAGEQPYVTDHHAQYVISGNRIGMRIMNGEEESYLPELTTDGARNLAPSCWLSTYELPAMAFLLHLTDGPYVEEIIECAVANYRLFFSDVETGRLLPVGTPEELEAVLLERYDIHGMKDIPQTMADYLLGRAHDAGELFRQRAAALLDKLIEQTEYKLTRYEDDKRLTGVSRKENKIGKKNYVQLKPGGMAAFLAKDMMFFQPDDGANSNKLTGLNFRVLQSVLATFSRADIDTLRRTLVSAHIIGDCDDAVCNPIVQRMWTKKVLPGCTQDFYEEYLRERLAYLKECRRAGSLRDLPFLHGNKLKWQEHDEDFSRQQAGRYLRDTYGGVECEKAVELPRGLFDRYIRKELMTMDSMKALATDYGKNVSYLIYAYFMRVMQDDCQAFYETRRSYRLFNTLYRKKTRDARQYRTADEIRQMLNRKHRTSVYADIEGYIKGINRREQDQERQKVSRLLSSMKSSETDLKRCRIQDMLLFLIAKKVFLSNVDDDVQAVAFGKLKLKDILDGKTLTQKIKFSINVMSKNGYVKTIKKDDLMLKHYANVYQILNDRRLPALLDLVRGRVIDHGFIEKEFSGYDKVHPGIIEEVFAYEKEYYEQHPDENGKEFGEMIYQSEQHSYEEKRSMRNIRNSFAHNTYPKYGEVRTGGEAELPNKAIAISDKFKEDLKKE